MQNMGSFLTAEVYLTYALDARRSCLNPKEFGSSHVAESGCTHRRERDGKALISYSCKTVSRLCCRHPLSKNCINFMG